MTTTLDERTVRPPESPAEKSAVEALAAAILQDEVPSARSPRTGKRRRPPTLVTETRQVEVPEELFNVFQLVVAALLQGQAVVIEPLDAVLTTQQAADKLHISRPTLIKLLEAGKIRYHKRGRHRRIMLADLLEYELQEQDARTRELDELSREAAHDGSADSIDEFVPTR